MEITFRQRARYMLARSLAHTHTHTHTMEANSFDMDGQVRQAAATAMCRFYFSFSYSSLSICYKCVFLLEAHARVATRKDVFFRYFMQNDFMLTRLQPQKMLCQNTVDILENHVSPANQPGHLLLLYSCERLRERETDYLSKSSYKTSLLVSLGSITIRLKENWLV
jgi:hypothetical protein